MKIVNPLGREVSSEMEAHFSPEPRACRCDEGAGSFTAAKGSDGCFHCGCACRPSEWEDLTENNDSTAFWTVRSSKA